MFFFTDTAAGVGSYTELMDRMTKLGIAAAGFITVGLGGVALAARSLYSQLKGVEKRVGGVEQQVVPVSHEITDHGPGTLASKVDTIKVRIKDEQTSRSKQHRDNTDRLDRIETRVELMQGDISGMRTVVDKILVHLAKLDSPKPPIQNPSDSSSPAG